MGAGLASSSRNMITCDRKSNIGYDFDVNLDVFYDDDRYDPGEIKHIMMDAFNSVVRRYGYGYCEDSTRVFTIKKIDHWRSRIMQSCDFAIVNNYTDKAGTVLQQYIRFNKKQRSYVWADQTKGYYTKPKEDWLKKHGYWDEVLDCYLYKKNNNEGLVKKSRALYAEAINEIYMKHRASQINISARPVQWYIRFSKKQHSYAFSDQPMDFYTVSRRSESRLQSLRETMAA